MQGYLEADLSEVSNWNIMDVNVRLGPSGIHGELALEKDALLVEMDRFGINTAVVSHFTAEEYDAREGNSALAGNRNVRLIPAWSALPDSSDVEALARRNPNVVKLCCASSKHNFSSASWCSGELLEYLQDKSILVLVSREDLQLGTPTGWDNLVALLSNFSRLPIVLLDLGYRSDRYLFPLLKRHTNLHFETSNYAAHRQLECYVEAFGSDRALFGSQLPLFTPGAALAVLISARISDEAKLAIAGGNLRRLLKVNPQ